jgi:hypothetical protein
LVSPDQTGWQRFATAGLKAVYAGLETANFKVVHRFLFKGNAMNTLVLQPTSVAQWQHLIQEATLSCDRPLDEGLESYLVFMLMRYASAADLADSVIALEYLRGLDSAGQVSQVRQVRLGAVGDKCLLLSGLFPGRAQRQRVQISYYVNIGKSAYAALATLLRGAQAALYQQLAQHFVALMDVLHAARELGHDTPALQPLQAMELWCDTGSPRAYARLRRYSDGTPLNTLNGCSRH